jgi:hypothetical protein
MFVPFLIRRGMVKTMMDEVFAIEAAVCSTSSH